MLLQPKILSRPRKNAEEKIESNKTEDLKIMIEKKKKKINHYLSMKIEKVGAAA